MVTDYLNSWQLFTIAFTLLLVVSYIMQKQSAHFYTQDVIVKKFSIMELELPATPKELCNVIAGMFQLPPAQSRKSLGALRRQLLLDFLLMPLVYGCIFLLCWRVAHKMQSSAGYILFMILAFIQLVSWICDVAENSFLLSQLKPDVTEMSKRTHRLYLGMEGLKWGIAITAAVCGISAVCYFWCTGMYSATSLRFFIIVLIEILVFLAVFFASKKQTALPE